MKLKEAIDRIDEMRPNTAPEEEKLRWIDSFDRMVRKEIIDEHGDAPEAPFSGYNTESAYDTELLVPSPYDDVYLYLLESRIAYRLGEISRYNNSAAMLQSVYDSFARDYHRRHTHKKAVYKYF